jgi:hypothetical protein
MSLDVYLSGETVEVPCRCPYCDHEHARRETETLYEANITHNLGAMAREAGIYTALWQPDEIGITLAEQLIVPLSTGLALMKSDPPRFEQHNSPNGWGLYVDFVPWVERYLAACVANPTATVSVSR